MELDTITSLNLRGLNDNIRAQAKLKMLAKLNSNIVVLQETKLRANIRFEWQNYINNYIVFENRNLTSCLGLAVLIRKDISNNYIINVENHTNRIMSVLMTEVNTRKQIRIYNVHTPILSYPRKIFFKNLEKLVKNDSIFCIAGDWNVANVEKEKFLSKFVKNIGGIDVMVEISKVLPPTRIDSRSQNTLDRVIISNNIEGSFSMKYTYIVYTDHIAISLLWKHDKGSKTIKFKRLIPNTVRLINIENKKLLIKIIELFNKDNNKLNAFMFWNILKDKLYNKLVEIHLEDKKQNNLLVLQLNEKINMEILKGIPDKNGFLGWKNKLEKVIIEQKKRHDGKN